MKKTGKQERIKSCKNFTKIERLTYIASKEINLDIIDYLIKRTKNIQIQILNKDKEKLIKLSKEGKLNNFSFQTTRAAIVFFNDDDYIESGYIKISKNNELFHSWICFWYDEEEYVFDPSLDVISKKEFYQKVFETQVLVKIPSYAVRNEILKKVSTDELQNEEIKIMTNENLNSFIYQSEKGYKIETDNGIIKKLIVHYYKNDNENS